MKILLVIDIQQRYLAYYDSNLLNRINDRIKKAKTAEIPIFYVRNTPRLANGENYDFAADLIMVSEHIYDKQSPSAFTNNLFAERLKELGVTEIEMIGVDGNCCVNRTCLDAVEAGYKVILPLNCIGFRNARIFEKTLAGLENDKILIQKNT